MGALDQFDSRTLLPTGRLRFAVPPDTTTEGPRLQQEWQSTLTAARIWMDVPTEVVSRAELSARFQISREIRP